MSIHDLNALKLKLEALETNITKSMENIKDREIKHEKVNRVYEEEYLKKQERINFNVCGQLYSTTHNSIMKHNNTLFNSILESYVLKNNEIILIDRDPFLFSYIIDYIRNKRINLKTLSKELIYKIRIEADYFEIWDLVFEIDNLQAEVKFIKFNTTGDYIFKTKIIGTNKLEDLSNKDLKTGICSTTPGKIIIEFNKEASFNEIDVAGFCGDDAWYSQNGKGADIFISKNGLSWEKVGKLAKLEKTIERVNLDTTATGKFIKFESNSYLGLGYLKIIDLLDD